MPPQHLTQFGELVARERRQREEIPRMEELLRNVKRLEEIWRDVYTADKVFEFLMRRIDLFNLRDKAAPAGLLPCTAIRATARNSLPAGSHSRCSRSS